MKVEWGEKNTNTRKIEEYLGSTTYIDTDEIISYETNDWKIVDFHF